MPLAALVLLACHAMPALAAFQGDDDNGPPPGSAFPPPPPLVADPKAPATPAPAATPPPAQETYVPTSSLYPPPPAPIKPRPAPTPPKDEGPAPDAGNRLLFGIGLQLGAGIEQFTVFLFNGGGLDPPNPGLGAGLYLRLGEQFNDLWAIDLELSGGTLIVLGYVRAAFTVDLTPVDWFTIALGPTARLDDSQNSSDNPSESLGGTLRLDFHLTTKRTEAGRRGLTLGIAADLGQSFAILGNQEGQPGLAFGGYLMLGWAWY